MAFVSLRSNITNLVLQLAFDHPMQQIQDKFCPSNIPNVNLAFSQAFARTLQQIWYSVRHLIIHCDHGI